MGSYASATPDYEADKAAFGSVSRFLANIEKAWEGGTYDPSKIGSYDWASNAKQTGITHGTYIKRFWLVQTNSRVMLHSDI